LPMSWGSGSGGFYVYLLMPFLQFFPLNELVLRLPNAILQISSIVFFYDWVKRMFGTRTALIGMLILVISPWHIMASRWALDANQIFALIIIGLDITVIAIEKNKLGLHILSMLFYSLALYSYGVALLVIPILLITIYGILIFMKKMKIHTTIIVALSLSFFALPVLAFYFINYMRLPELITPFFSIPLHTEMRQVQTIISFDSNFMGKILENIANISVMITYGTRDYVWNIISDYGIYYVFTFPFIFLGGSRLLKLRSFDEKKITLLALLIASIVPSLIIHQNINRVAIVFIPVIVLMAIGIDYILQGAVKWGKVLLLFLAIVNTTSFGFYYFNYYNVEIEDEFAEGYGDAIEFAQSLSSSTVYLPSQSEVNGSYVIALFYLQIDMNDYLQTRVYSNPGGAFQYVSQFTSDGVLYYFNDSSPLYYVNPDEVYIYKTDSISLVLDNNAQTRTFDNFIVIYK